MAGSSGRSANLQRKRIRQQTIEDVLGKTSRRRYPAASKGIVRIDHSNENARGGHDDDSEGDDSDAPPIRRRGRRGKTSSTEPTQAISKSRHGVVVDSSEDEDVAEPEEATGSREGFAGLARGVLQGHDDCNGSDDSDGSEDSVRPAKRRRQSHIPPTDRASSDEELAIRTPSPKQTHTRLVRSTPSSAAVTNNLSRSARKSGLRSARQRHMELFRRRRQGEKINEDDLASDVSDANEPRTALYDKDPDLVALSDFDDEEKEEVVEQEEEQTEEDTVVALKKRKKEEKKRKKKEKKEKRREQARREQALSADAVQLRSAYEDEEEEDDGYDYGRPVQVEEAEVDDDMSDFIDDSGANLIGAPDEEEAMMRREIPLQFTFQAHKPLKSHFKDAVEWLIHRRVNPGGAFAESDDELYRVAWDRLDREVGGLARSRFVSSVWTPAFYSTLRARPYMDSFNIRPSGAGSRGGGGGGGLGPGLESNVCDACGRTNHPASFLVRFGGKAYDSKTLDDLEDDGEDDEDDEDDKDDKDDDGHESVDMDGNTIAPISRQWFVGATCHSNAETAHDLLHWRRALRDWIDEKLRADGLLTSLEGRKKKMKTRKRRALANTITDDWEANGTINSLFREFTKMLEEAQAKSTKTPSRFGR